MGRIANPVCGEIRTAGSNPALSASFSRLRDCLLSRLATHGQKSPPSEAPSPPVERGRTIRQSDLVEGLQIENKDAQDRQEDSRFFVDLPAGSRGS